jgi:prolyl-tRNA synthetase
LKARRGIEVGHVFKLGTRYSEPFGAYVPGADGDDRPIIMGCYGIGVGRMLAAAIEQHHDDKGITFPAPIAPYHASLVALNVADPEIVACADDVYARLGEAGIEVLYDDRSETAGVKFNDADLLGLPLRIVVSARNLAQDAVEIKGRSESVAVTVPNADLVHHVREMLSVPSHQGAVK